MTAAKRAPLQTTEISGVPLDYIALGAGRPLLFLHGIEGPDTTSDLHLRELARHFRVLAPWHPGFGKRNRPEGFRDVSDLAYLYLDLVETLQLRDTILVGASFGGWVAAEMLVRDATAFSHLVLSAPLGIKVRGREDRDIADFFSLTDEEFREIAYADPSKGTTDLAALDDEELTGHFRSRETFAFYGWKPYMHNPQLRRWLHRIKLPTLMLTGERDRFVFDGYHAAYNAGVSRSNLVTLGEAGHFPHIELPEEFARRVVAHCGPAAQSTANAA